MSVENDLDRLKAEVRNLRSELFALRQWTYVIKRVLNYVDYGQSPTFYSLFGTPTRSLLRYSRYSGTLSTDFSATIGDVIPPSIADIKASTFRQAI